MNETSAWSSWLRDIAGTYAAVDAQRKIIKASTVPASPTTNTTPAVAGGDGAPVPKPIDRKWLIGGGIAAALVVAAFLLKKK